MSKHSTLSSHMQDCVILLSVTSQEFLRLVRSFLRPEILPSSIGTRILRACYKYYDLTKDSPNDHVCDLMQDEVKTVDKAQRQLTFDYLDRISQMREPNVDYVISKLSNFIKTREFEVAAVEFVKLVEREDFEKAQNLMFQALRAGIEKENIGCDYFTDFTSMRRSVDPWLIPYGIEHLDYIRKLRRKELLCIMGGYKGKKSWAGHHIGHTALLHGLNVLHISHENSQEECEERYDRMSGSLAGRDVGDKSFDLHELDVDSGKMISLPTTRPCVTSEDARKKARRTLQRFGGRLIIKKFSMGQCSTRDLERYVDYLETYEDFVPDVMINDYPDIMKHDPNKATRDNLNENYIWHKGMADERNMLMVVFSQATRAAIRAKRLKMGDFAEDIRKLANIDTAIGVCQTEAQAMTSIASMYIIAARQGPMDCGCGIVQNLDCGQFCTQSFPLKLGKEAVEVAEEEKDDEAKSS